MATTASGPDDFSPDWLTQALRGSIPDDANVTSAQVTPLGRGHGVIGSLYRINLEYDVEAPDAPRSLIAKLPARIGPIRDLAARFNMYEREARFYEEIASELSLPTPQLYYSATSDDGGLTLLLEDMSPALAGDLMAGSTLDQMQELLRTVAELHAAWWNSPKLDTLAWLPSLNDRAALEIGADFAGEAWDIFVKNFGEHLPPPVQRLGSVLRNDRSVLDRLSARPRTLVHADLRLNNLMFREGGSLSAVLDWQSTVAARGPVDVARLFVNNLEPADRRTAEAELLPEYHRQLAELGVRDYSYAECWRDYRLAVINQFGQVVVLSSMLDVDSEIEDELGPKTGTRLVVALLDLNLLELVLREPAWKRAGRKVRNLLRAFLQ